MVPLVMLLKRCHSGNLFFLNSLTLQVENWGAPQGHVLVPGFLSVLSNVLKFTTQWMFLYVKRWEGNGVRNWCSGGQLGVKKEWFQGSLAVKSFNYTAKFMLEQSNVNMFWPPSTFIRIFYRRTNHRANTWMQALLERSATPEALMRPRIAQRQSKCMNNNTYTQKLTTAEQKIWRNTEKVKCHYVGTR